MATTSELRTEWLREAARHEAAVDGIHACADEPESASDREERLLHLECARVYRKCASEIKWAE